MKIQLVTMMKIKSEDRYDSLIQYYAQDTGFDWLWLKAQIKAESAFEPEAVSPVGAVGLSQFMRATWEEWRDGTPGIQAAKMIFNRTNPEHCIRAQAAYLKWLRKMIDRTPGITKERSFDAIFAAYNWGIGSVRRMVAKEGFFNFNALPDETQKYLTRIHMYYKNYKHELKKEE